MRRAEAVLSKAQMRRDIELYRTTGKRPTTEPAASFANMLDAFDRVCDASIGGGDYPEAVAAYNEAAERLKKAEEGITWT